MAKRRPPGSDDPRWTSDVAPAPGELKIVQAFVNTVDREIFDKMKAAGSFICGLGIETGDL